ncbi:MAG: hypothetical protein AAF772_01155, partial [Acidobacteriota bacterium]
DQLFRGILAVRRWRRVAQRDAEEEIDLGAVRLAEAGREDGVDGLRPRQVEPRGNVGGRDLNQIGEEVLEERFEESIVWLRGGSKVFGV